MDRSVCAAALRAADKASGIEGYAATFNELSVVLYGMFREEIAPGAFRNTLGDDIRSLWNHNTDLPLARTTNGTLRLAEDETGLAIAADLPETSWGRDALISIGRRDVTQMSFAFDVIEDDWREDDLGQLIRRLLNVKLYEVSPVTFPAYPTTTVGLRSIPSRAPKWVTERMAGSRGVPLSVRRRQVQLMSYAPSLALPR